MTIVSKSQHDQTTTAKWRLTPGYLHEGYADFESAHILLGRFLADRNSPNPLAEKEIFAPDGIFEWGQASPLEKVINSREDFEFLLKHPSLLRKSIDLTIALKRPRYLHLCRTPVGC